MAKKEKAKFLQGSNRELLEMLVDLLAAGEEDELDTKKMSKIVAELLNREPEESEGVSLEDAIAKLKSVFAEGIEAIESAYQAEMDKEPVENDEDESDEDEEVVDNRKKSKKDKKGKKKREKDEEASLDEEEENEDYESMSKKELKSLCRERGIKVSKDMGKDDFIEALEADDKE